MEVKEALTQRKSCRAFTTERIPEEQIAQLLWAGGRAPYASGGPRRMFEVVRDEETRLRLQHAANGQRYVGECDTVIVVSGTDEGTTLQSGYPKYLHDCDAAAMCIILMATALGIGSCWIGHFSPHKVNKALGTVWRPVVLVLLGYAQ